MVDAFTWQRNNESKSFRTRAELYDFMIEQGEVIIEGDDAALFEKHCNARKAKNPKAIEAMDKVTALRGY